MRQQMTKSAATLVTTTNPVTAYHRDQSSVIGVLFTA
jgi:hypothetical protein